MQVFVGKQMKPGIAMQGAAHPTRPWTAASEAVGRMEQAAVTAPPNWHKQERIKAQRNIAIRIKNRYVAAPGCIFDAWLDPEVAGSWLFATASQPMVQVEIDARVGGSFRFANQQLEETIEFTGQYIEIVPDRRLVFTLVMAPRPHVVTRVTVAIAPLTKGCALTLTHENVPRDYANYLEGRWTGILYGLGVMLDPISVTFHRDQRITGFWPVP